jgi:hypothetical protein
VLHHPFTTHTEQWRWAIGQLPEDTEWVLGLDADQELSPEVAAEIRQVLPATAPGAALAAVEGIYINRRNVYRGRWLKHGGLYPKYLLKLFRRRAVVFDEKDLVDHHFFVRGATHQLQHDMREENYREENIAFWVQKHNQYAQRMAREQMLRDKERRDGIVQPDLFGTPDQRMLWMKYRWYEMPLYVRPVLYFVWRYVLRLGFLDGKQGFLFHFMQALWFRMLVDVNIEELRRAEGR